MTKRASAALVRAHATSSSGAVPGARGGTVHLTFARVTAEGRAAWEMAARPHLLAEELARLEATTDPQTRAQRAVGRALLRLTGARAAGCAPCELRVARRDGGKPWLPDVPGLHISLAHSGAVVVLAATAAAAVGVDVESAAEVAPDPGRLARRLFAESEVREFESCPAEQVSAWFTSVWTVKEAVGKALGVGIIPALSRVVVLDGGRSPALAAVHLGPPADGWTIHQRVAPGGDETISVAVAAPDVTLARTDVLTLDGFQAVASGRSARRGAEGLAARPPARAPSRAQVRGRAPEHPSQLGGEHVPLIEGGIAHGVA